MTDEIDTGAVPPQPAATSAASPRGLGGWLILPMLGLIASVGSELLQLPDMFTAFGQLGVSGMDGIASNLVQLDMILALALYLVAPAILLILMFGKKRSFPRNFIRWAIAAAIFVVFDIFLGYWLSHAALEAQGASFFDYGFLREITGPIAALCIWTPYLLNSQRVKNTFVN